MYFACIQAKGEFIHEITSLDEFYKAFGYTQDMNKDGVLPEEFIWDEYIKDSTAKSTACYQMHIIKYLKKHSDTFRKQFGDLYEGWLADLARLRAEAGLNCVDCRMDPFCKKES